MLRIIILITLSCNKIEVNLCENQIKRFSVSKIIKIDSNNFNKHSETGMELLEKSIDEVGVIESIAIDKDGSVITGNARKEIFDKKGFKPKVVRLEKDEYLVIDTELEGAQRIKAAILANTTAHKNYNLDMDLIQEIAVEEYDIDIEELGVEIVKDNNSHHINEDDFEIPKERETDIIIGDLFEIKHNNITHRLLCGDATKKEDVERLMYGQKAGMVFTDPPYGMKKEADGILNDNLNYDDLLAFNCLWIKLSFDFLKNNGSWYCWGIDEPLMDIYSVILKPLARQNKITFRNLITWSKGSGQGQNSELTRMYAIADEKCLFVMSGVQGFNNNSDNYFEKWDKIRLYLEGEAKKVELTNKHLKNLCGVSDMYSHWFTKSQWSLIPEKHYLKIQEHYKSNDAFKKEYDEIKKEYDEIKKEYYGTRSYFNNTHDNMNNVWNFPPTSPTERSLTGNHSTPKPIKLCSRAIMSSSRENDIVLDLFGGSGSTLITCSQLNRICYMMELSPEYCQVIIDRAKSLFPNSEIIKINV